MKIGFSNLVYLHYYHIPICLEHISVMQTCSEYIFRHKLSTAYSSDNHLESDSENRPFRAAYISTRSQSRL